MLVHTGQVSRRSELTERLGVTRTGVGGLLRELEALRLLRTGPDTAHQDRTGGGRPSPTVALHPDAPVGLAVQVQIDGVVIADARLGGRLTDLQRVPLAHPGDPAAVLAVVADLIRARLPADGCVGIGLAVPSAIGPGGVALSALPLQWPAGVPVLARLSALLARGVGADVPLTVGNDANLAALAESRHGAGRGAAQMLFVTSWPHGVGGGLVIDGRLHTGSSGHALEVGHITVDPAGGRCYCGNTGCLELAATPAALVALSGVPVAADTDVVATADRILHTRATDPAAAAALDTVVEHLATGLGALINILDPDRIVLGSFQADLYRADPQVLRDAVGRRSYLAQANQLDIVPAELRRSALVGAAELALQPLLDDPRRRGAAPV